MNSNAESVVVHDGVERRVVVGLKNAPDLNNVVVNVMGKEKVRIWESANCGSVANIGDVHLFLGYSDDILRNRDHASFSTSTCSSIGIVRSIGCHSYGHSLWIKYFHN